MTDLDLERGTVVKWRATYGFIHVDGSGSDIFVHVSGLRDGLKGLEPGRRVAFEIVINEKSRRPKAVRCRYERE
jgi:cold shock CspA family protein